MNLIRSDIDGGNSPVLRVRELSFSYPDRPIFTGWSADFPAGLSWVRGGNGCGKSTLLKLLAGALPPLLGQLSVRGVDLLTDRLAYQREVYWCGPQAIAFDHLQPAEYYRFLAGLYPRFDVPSALQHAQALGLAPFMTRRLREMSTGTQRKAWLAAALAANAAVVLLDEPLAALDQASLRTVRQQLQRCAASPDTAWIVVSHEPLGDAEAQARLIDLEAPAA